MVGGGVNVAVGCSSIPAMSREVVVMGGISAVFVASKCSGSRVVRFRM